MKSKTNIALIFCWSLFLVIISSWYGYKSAEYDAASLATFSDASRNAMVLKILREKGTDVAIEFLETDLDLAISIHRGLVSTQSILSCCFYDENDQERDEHYLQHYRHISEYRDNYESPNNQQEVKDDLKWLMERRK